MTDPQPITLGEKYRDKITGFQGLATSRHEYLYGCVRYSLESELATAGGKSEEFTFDEQRLVPVPAAPVAATATSGGPRPTPPRTGSH